MSILPCAVRTSFLRLKSNSSISNSVALTFSFALHLSIAVVKSSAEHDRFGRAIAPTEPGQFRPERCRSAARVGQISTKGEIAGVEQAVDSIGESECFRGLCERNIRGRTGKLPVRALRTPLMRYLCANFSAKRVGIKFQPNALFTKMRQVGCDGLKIETTGERQAGERQAIILPIGRPAQI